MRFTEIKSHVCARFGPRSLGWTLMLGVLGALALVFLFHPALRHRGAATPAANVVTDSRTPAARTTGPEQRPGAAGPRIGTVDPTGTLSYDGEDRARNNKAESAVDARAVAAAEPATAAIPDAVQTAMWKLGHGVPPQQIEGKAEGDDSLYEIRWKGEGYKKQAVVDREGSVLWADEVRPLSQLPDAVVATLSGRGEDGAVHYVESLTKKGPVAYYDARTWIDGRQRTLLIDPSGQVLWLQEEVAWDALPPSVRAGLERNADGGEIARIESVAEGDTLVEYTAMVRTPDGKRRITVGPDGEPRGRGRR